MNGQEKVDDGFICQVAGITKEELAQAREIDQNRNAPKGMMAMMMAAAAKQPEVMPVKKEEGEHSMSGMMKNMMKQMGEGKTPEERLEMAKKMGAPEEALERMKAAMERENGEKGPDAKTGGMQVNKGTGGNPDMSAMMKAMMGKKA